MNLRHSALAEPTTVDSAGLTITRLGHSLGAEISGIDLGRNLAQEQVEAIEQALAWHELLIFRNQEITADGLVAFGRRFGELTVHPFAPSDGSAPVLITFRNDEKTRPSPPMSGTPTKRSAAIHPWRRYFAPRKCPHLAATPSSQA